MINKFKKLKNFLGPKVFIYLLIAIFVGFLWFLIESFFVFVLQGFLLSVGLLNKGQVFLPSWYPTSLMSTITLLILFGVGRSLVYFLRSHFAGLTQVVFVCEKRAKLLNYSLHNVSTISSKKLFTIFSDTTTHSGSVIYYTSLLINTVISSFLFFVLGLRIAPVEMLVGIFLLFVFLFPLKFLSKKINNFGNEIHLEWESVNGVLLKGLKNYFFLRIHNQIEKEIRIGQTSLFNYQKNYVNYSYAISFLGAFPLLMGILIVSFITYLSVTFIKTDGVKLVSFLFLFVRLAQSASEANSTFAVIRLNLPGIKMLYDWCDKADAHNEEYSLPKRVLKHEDVSISLSNLNFNYPGKPNILSNLNLNISCSDVLIIKGESGSGKSTLLSLILDIIKPTSGSVIINNIDSNKYNILFDSIIGYVGPEPYLIDGTIKDNILYGNSHSCSESDIYEILKTTELFVLINSLPHGLNQKIGDLAQISTGQKQRLALARALLRKPKLLILDEATANLDPETESKIIENLKHFTKNLTTIVVTHKDSFDYIGSKFINLKI